MMPPWPLRAFVLAHDPDNDAMTVMLASGQMPTYVVKRLYHGAVDALRINKGPLPSRGSWGLVIFPSGDVRNGIWLGAYQPHQIDAITSGPEDPFADYHSYFSGHWSYMNGVSGYLATQYADGSYFTAGSAAPLPTMYRHIVDDKQNRQRIAFPFSARNPSPKPPFTYTFTQSGTHFSMTVNGSGSGTLTFNTGQTLTIQQSGTTTSIVIASGGNVTITAATVLVSGNLHVSGEVTAKYGTGNSVTVSQHLHDGVMTGSGDTSAPLAGT